MSYIKDFLKKNYAARAFFIYMLGTILLNGIGLLTTPIFTRLLTANDFGITTIFHTWVTFFAVFIGLQVSGSIATARVHKEKELFDEYMKNIIVLSLLGGIIITFICLLFMEQLSIILKIDVKLIPHLLVQAYGTSCVTLYSTYTIQTKKPKKNVAFSLIVTLGIVVLSLILTLYLRNDKYLGKIYTGTVIYIFVIIFVLRSFLLGKKLKLSMLDWKYCIGLSLPLIIHLLSNIIIGQSDRLFIKSLIGNEAAAIYSVAYSIGTLGIIFADLCNNIWSPWYLDNTKMSNHAKINNVARKYALAVSGVFIMVMVMAPEIIKIMAPKEYWSGISSLIIVAVSVFFQYLYRFPLAFEQYSKNLRWVAVSTISSALINMMLNYFFISLFGMIGAAIATLISYMILFGMHEFVARKILKGYNIGFGVYIPGIISCFIFAVISFVTIDLWFARYGILLIFIVILTILLLKHLKQGAKRIK